jgi:hypothetical protein
MAYTITSEHKDKFVSVLLLDYLINGGGKLPILMDGGFKPLEPLAVKLHAKGYLQISGDRYTPTAAGRESLKLFMQRYSEYLRMYDVFSYVDLTAGEFAFSKFFDTGDDEWKAYLADERWEDVRIAVAEHKKLDPLEIVFMSFVSEGRFDLEKTGWQFDLYSGLIWGELVQVCNSALTVEQINQGNETVMPDIVEQGARLSVGLIKRQAEIEAENREADRVLQETVKAQQQSSGAAATEEVIEEETIVYEDYSYPYTYYEPYYDPFYVSPIWVAPLFIW